MKKTLIITNRNIQYLNFSFVTIWLLNLINSTLFDYVTPAICRVTAGICWAAIVCEEEFEKIFFFNFNITRCKKNELHFTASSIGKYHFISFTSLAYIRVTRWKTSEKRKEILMRLRRFRFCILIIIIYFGRLRRFHPYAFNKICECREIFGIYFKPKNRLVILKKGKMPHSSTTATWPDHFTACDFSFPQESLSR